jgi:hypothetical protein
MPYLSCPSCRLTVYNPPTVVAPERCPRCSAQLATVPASLFPPRRGMAARQHESENRAP